MVWAVSCSCGVRSGLFVWLLFYAILQLYIGRDMMYETRMRKPKPTLLQTQSKKSVHHNAIALSTFSHFINKYILTGLWALPNGL